VQADPCMPCQVYKVILPGHGVQLGACLKVDLPARREGEHNQQLLT
jgi:hypothetical protein